MSIKKRVKKLVNSKHMLTGIGTASFLESTIVPIPLEALLVPLMQKRRDKLWLIASITTFGCILGALAGYTVGYFIFDLSREFIMLHITSESQFAKFEDAMATNGFWFVFSTGVTPVPLQIATLAAGVSQYSLVLFTIAVAMSRVVRYFGIAIIVYYFGDKTEKLIKQYKWQVSLGCCAVIIGILFWRF